MWRSTARSAGSSGMPEPDLLTLFVAPLAELGCSYLVTGSVAATLYGEPRATHDIDLVVDLSEANQDALPGAFPAPPRHSLDAEPGVGSDRRSDPGRLDRAPGAPGCLVEGIRVLIADPNARASADTAGRSVGVVTAPLVSDDSFDPSGGRGPHWVEQPPPGPCVDVLRRMADNGPTISWCPRSERWRSSYRPNERVRWRR